MYLRQGIREDVGWNRGKIDFVDLECLYLGSLSHHFEHFLHLEGCQLGLAEIELSNVIHYESQLEGLQPGQTVEAEVEDPQPGLGGEQRLSESRQLELPQLGVLQPGLAQLGHCSVRHQTSDRQ